MKRLFRFSTAILLVFIMLSGSALTAFAYNGEYEDETSDATDDYAAFEDGIIGTEHENNDIEDETDLVDAGSCFTLYDDISLYFQCETMDSPQPIIVTVIFDGNGGVVDSYDLVRQTYQGSSLGNAMPLAEPIRTGFNFIGWNTIQDGTETIFTAETYINDDPTIVIAQWIEDPVQTPVPQIGRINITNIADGYRQRISGAVFGIFDAMSDERVAEVVANSFGEAFAFLEVGNYYLRQIIAPDGFQLNMDRFNFTIRANAITEVTVINRPIEEELPQAPPRHGSLLVTALADGSNERLQNVSFTVYNSQTNVGVANFVTDHLGEFFAELPIGDYFLRQTAVPDTFIINPDRVAFRIGENRLTDLTVRIRPILSEAEPTPSPVQESTPNPPPSMPTPTPTPPAQQTPIPPNQTSAPPSASGGNSAGTTQRPPTPSSGGNLQILARAEQTGDLLQGAAFVVYRVSDNSRITELVTDINGQVTHGLPPGEYFLRQIRATFGYLPETARIFFTVENRQTIVVEVTNQRDVNISDSELEDIELPQTGELLPIVNYVFGGILLLVAMLCGIAILTGRNHKEDRKNKKGDTKAYV